ncbi:hypothetical protein D029_4396 [Vibrio parahaemolyticus 970107]|nr:hypothetical protein D029_4396 [Vibrio parahaemolyticus 970107]
MLHSDMSQISQFDQVQLVEGCIYWFTTPTYRTGDKTELQRRQVK